MSQYPPKYLQRIKKFRLDTGCSLQFAVQQIKREFAQELINDIENENVKIALTYLLMNMRDLSR